MRINKSGALTRRTSLAFMALLASALLFTESFPETIERLVTRGGTEEAIQFSFFASGTASWYGAEFHGKKTSNGELFDKNAFTAAHRTLPFGTIVLVRNLNNGKEVLVRINDRGPFVKNRIIDLSEAGGRALDMLRTGTASVLLYVMKPLVPPSTSAGVPPAGSTGSVAQTGATATNNARYRVQAGSFSVLANAEALVTRIKSTGLVPLIETAVVNGKTLYRVLVMAEETTLEGTIALLRNLGITAPLVTKVQ